MAFGKHGEHQEIRAGASKHDFGIELAIIVDIIHVIEYLWNAGRVFHPESGTELENWVRHRLLGVLRSRAGLVAGGMRRRTMGRRTRKQWGQDDYPIIP